MNLKCLICNQLSSLNCFLLFCLCHNLLISNSGQLQQREFDSHINCDHNFDWMQLNYLKYLGSSTLLSKNFDQSLFSCINLCLQERRCNLINLLCDICYLYLNEELNQTIITIYNKESLLRHYNLRDFTSYNKFKRDVSILQQSNSANSLVVSATNQTIQLPTDQAILSSFVVPQSDKYKYNWELIAPLNGEDIGNIEGLNTNQVKLSHLKAGNYSFKVTVSDTTGIWHDGNAIVSLIVLPTKTKNKPPVVIIQPNNSTVQLPNKDTVLDGSLSTDDDKIVKFEWQAIKVPIGYKNMLLPNSSILQLKDLIAGLYVFNLTVTDLYNATNSTTATISVLKEIDYPPTANAGPDNVIYLPQNELTLNGNKSIDDKGIVSWHWTRVDEGSMAIDMNGTSTPYLHLAKLEIGVYKFVLQVTDKAGQTSKDETNVIVKPENNEAPKSNAGSNEELVLPIKDPVYLDGSKSTDDISITKWQWLQVNGLKKLSLINSNSSKATIIRLTPGIYNFSLTVWDAKNLSSISYKTISVIQKTNSPPKSIAGGDHIINLPIDEVLLNGSNSYDDAEIVSYKWERLPLSLACGDIVGNSSNSSVLRLSNLEAGRYLFQLTVTDAQGAASTDVASLIVKASVDLLDTIEIVLNSDIQSFTFEQQIGIFKRLEFMLNDEENNVRINVLNIRKTLEKRIVLTFIVFDANNKRLAGTEIVRKLKLKVKSNRGLLYNQIVSLQTSVCQNKCSSHGVCDQHSKRCMCEAFWMENFIRLYFGDNESNCDWSVLYVIIISFTLLILLTVFLWAFICLISKYNPDSMRQTIKRRRRLKRNNNRHRYTLIDDECDTSQIQLMPTTPNGINNSLGTVAKVSDSSDESEIAFNLNNYRNGYDNGQENKINSIT